MVTRKTGWAVTGLELHNIRAFKHLALDLGGGDGPRMLSVIIGRNGTCKSTLLRCIALGLCHPADASALLAEPGGQLVAEGAEEGRITLRVASRAGEPSGEIELRIGSSEGRDVLRDQKATVSLPEMLVCGYGAGRGITGTPPQMRPSYRVMDSVATLFDYRHTLVDAELMLRRLEDHLGSSRYDRAMKGIKQALGLGPRDRLGYAKGGGVTVSGPGIGDEIPMEAWADGYRMTFTWIIDLYGWAMQADAITKEGAVRGILLIDEIEQHLHPSMQAGLLHELRRALPEMQIFATTHSALAALGAGSEHVIALHRRGRAVRVAAVPSFAGYSAEDVLVEGALFGTDPYSGDTRKKLDRHRRLASAPPSRRSKKETAEMAALAAELDPARLPHLRDDPVAQKLDELADLLQQEIRS